jgi:hypothetical protein
MFGSKGSASGSDEPTEQEVATEAMRQRILKHISNWYQGYTLKSPSDLDFITNDGGLELWTCSLLPPNGNADESKNIWLFWNTREVVSHDSYKNAFVDFVSEQRSRKIEGRFKYFTSPLTVSAVLEFCMLVLITYLLCFHNNVPDQLWSVFTAVVAFYFGRESGARSGETGVQE